MLTVSLNIAVGEQSQLGVKRRFIDLANMRRLVLSHSDTVSSLVLGNVRLESVALLTSSFPKLIRLDLGVVGSPLQKGFTSVTTADYYSTLLGFGLNGASIFSGSRDRGHPTNLLRDWIGFYSGGIDIDLPADIYTVHAWLTDAGQYE